MKTQKLFWMMAMTACAVGLGSCDDSDDWGSVDNAAPTIQLTSAAYKGAVGRNIPIEGTIADADGISTINLKCADLLLNKTIDIIDIYGEPLKSYDLRFSFPISKDETKESFAIDVTVTDVCGNSVTQTMTVTTDGDFENPAFTTAPGAEVTIIMKSRTTYNLNINVSDDQNLKEVTLQIEGLAGYENKVYQVSGKSGSISEKILFPNEENTYKLVLRVTDMENKVTEQVSLLKITSEVPDYANLWLADVATAEELNSDIFGVPMYVDHAFNGEEPIPYTYEARYYNQKAGTEVKFLGQKTDFSPVCYGCDATDPTLLSDDDESLKGIKLDQANTYYRITFCIKDYSMKIETYSIADAKAAFRTDLIGQVAFDTWGNGNEADFCEFKLGYLNGGPSDVQAFTQDKTNPNLFNLESLTVDADNNLKYNEEKDSYNMNFIIHNWHPGGWWDVCAYKPNSSEDPEFWPWWGNNSQLLTDGWEQWPGYQKVRESGDKWCKPVVPTSKFGDYSLWFDAHLQRAKLIKK